MPRPRDEPDSLRDKRRQLAEQERLLNERMARLARELQEGPDAGAAKKALEPPVWRLEEEGPASHRPADPNPAKVRNLARQRQRDKILFFIFIAVALVATFIFIWLYRTHAHGTDS